MLYAVSEWLQPGDGEAAFTARVRYRTVGDMTITGAVRSDASDVEAIIAETAVTRLTEHLAADTREYGISVFAITPGLVYTPLARQTFESEAGQRYTPHYREVYAERHVPPELVAERCVALASGRVDRLSGCYIQLADDLDDLAARADEIEAQGLYTLRIKGEDATPTTPRVAKRP
jgi:NAD(P)-dependent dehydrogenase (short-subunit alcohol dehydrogenase family)